jgi:hypothetical protein
MYGVKNSEANYETKPTTHRQLILSDDSAMDSNSKR